MRKTSFVPTMYLTLGLALTPAAAFANHGGFHGGRVAVGQVAGGPVVTRPFVTHPFVSHPFVAHPFLHHRFFRPFVPFGVITSPVVIYASPPVAYSAPPTSYDSPPIVGNVAVAPAPAPMPTVVQYPEGRYELRGDGVTTAYTWVWIPNPPPPRRRPHRRWNRPPHRRRKRRPHVRSRRPAPANSIAGPTNGTSCTGRIAGTRYRSGTGPRRSKPSRPKTPAQRSEFASFSRRQLSGARFPVE